MKDWDLILKNAKECHTKEAWNKLLEQYKDDILNAKSTKPIHELFKLLKLDPQCLQYEPELWASLISACISAWELDLGIEISRFAQKVASAKIAIPAAQVHMESGAPALARKTASRALRLTNVKPWENLQLQMIVCNSYVEEGKHVMALRLLQKMETAVSSASLNTQNLADLLINMARAQFFLGRYPEAASIFYQAYERYIQLEEWGAAAIGIYNAAASWHNGGSSDEKAFHYVEKCKALCIQHRLEGPLSHCYAFYATSSYQHGEFEKASIQYRKALSHLPESEKWFRRLHITSMLAFTWLKLGRLQLANKYGNMTIELAARDQSERFRSRYKSLQAELYWSEGRVQDSQSLIEEEVKSLFLHGIHTLEELSTLNQYFLQCAYLNQPNIQTKVKISDQLKKNNAQWMEHLHALAQLHLTQMQYAEAWKKATACYELAVKFNRSWFIVQGLITMSQIKLAQKQTDQIDTYLAELERVLKNKERPLKVHIHLIKAALAYHKGDFNLTKQILAEAAKYKRVDFVNRSIINSWLATINGHSPRLSLDWQFQLLARATKVYFSPSFEPAGETSFLVSGQYTVNLHRFPVLAKMIRHLLSKNQFTASSSELQEEVWKQSLKQQGWQQKIRNTVMRMRDSFPYTMAPLIIHSDNQIRLYEEAICLRHLRAKCTNAEEEILKLLKEGPMSSVQLSNKILVSQATTKRVLKKLTESHRIFAEKSGRKVLYKSEETNALDMN